MKIIINKTLIFLMALVLMTSCKSYLDIKPYGKTIPKTAEEFSAMMHTILNDIDYGEDYLVGDNGTVVDYSSFSDNLEASITMYPGGNFLPSYIGSKLSSKQLLYTRLYETIRNCNIVLDNLDDQESELGQNVVRVAYSLRGVAYYQLLRNFCEPYSGDPLQLGVPIVNSFDMEEKPIRSTYSETVNQIISDFNKAKTFTMTDEVYRFNDDVINGYLARLYFWVQDYTNAITYASDILEKYPLLEGEAYIDMMTSQNARKGNMIFKSATLSNSSTKTALDGNKRVLVSRPISKRFIDAFEDGDKDIRYSLSFTPEREFNKILISDMRSAEMCLILAESYYHNSSNENALQYLNLLRSKRIENFTPYTMATLPEVNPNEIIKVDAKGEALTPLINSILNERRKEFFLESGDRWYELKRNGRPTFWMARNGHKYTTEKFMYTFPLPVMDVILVDGLIQNEGYDKVI